MKYNSVCHNFIIFIILGNITGFISALIFLNWNDIFFMDQPRDFFYHYGGLVGGILTFIAAIIGLMITIHIASKENLRVKQEQNRYRLIVKEELRDTFKKIEAYIVFIDNDQEGYTISEASRDAIDKAEECEFQIPEVLTDYSTLSKLDERKIPDVIAIRNLLSSVKKEYYKSKGSSKIGLFEELKKVDKLLQSALGEYKIRVKPVRMNLTFHPVTIQKR